MFRRHETNGAQEATITLTETQTPPLQAALQCRETMSSGSDAFTKCWMRSVATSKQKEILDCFEKSKSNATFMICANRDRLSNRDYRVANCAEDYIRNRIGGKFLRCIADDQLNEQQARIFDCAVNNNGNLGAIGSCAIGGTMTEEQRRVYACVANNTGDYVRAGLCAAGKQLTPEQSRIAGCVLNNRGNYAQMGICAAGNNLTPEQQAFATCAMSTGGQPYAFAGCVGTQLTVNELQKCFTQGIGGQGCFGTNNTAVKTITNAWHDVTKGPGPGNEIVKGREAILGGDRGTVANVIRDPIKCLTFQRKC